ncbi:transmembrane secretion effector [Isoptericola variabilis J7]|uniref:MFS transporter n=1 Tax=Isoptericola variabilis TaxID=139208 RepID=UPI0011A8C9EB|nr:MFS transporter [Isoptericola variabilis]TWH35010.1 transmembrane secretion effector [Isoptericola variabilis J7]
MYDGAIRAVLPSIVARKDLAASSCRSRSARRRTRRGRCSPSSCPSRRQLSAGYRFVRGHDMLWPLWMLSVAIGVCHSAATSTYVLFALDEVGVPEAWYGTFLLVGAAGGLLGSPVAGRLGERFGTGRVMAAANALGLVAWVAACAASVLGVAAAAMFVSFGCTVVWNVHVMSLRQALVPDRMLGRVHGTWRTLLWGAMPVGSLLGGLLARGGLELVLALAGYRFLAGLPDPADVPPSDPADDATSDATADDPSGARHAG